LNQFNGNFQNAEMVKAFITFWGSIAPALGHEVKPEFRLTEPIDKKIVEG